MATGKRDIPDLQIPDLEPAASVPASRAGAPAGASRPGPGLDDDFELGSALSLEPAAAGDAGGAGGFGDDDALELGSGHGHAAPSAGALGGGLELGGAGGAFDPDFDELEGSTAAAVDASVAHEAPKRRAWPTGITAEPDPTAFDPRDIDQLAGYGDPPASFVLAPLYAVRVASRRRELKVAAARAAEELEARERARDEALGRMVRALEPELTGDDRTRKLLADAQRARSELAQQQRRLAGANAEYHRQRGEVDQLLERIDGDIGRAEAVVDQRRAVEDGHRTTQQRIEAKEKRLFIELRPMADASEKGQPLTAEQRQKVTRIEAEIGALKPELAAARAATEAAVAARKAAEGDVAEQERARREAERKKRAIEHTFAKQIGSESAAVTEAERALRDALAAAGREVLAMKGTVAIPEPTLDALLAADRRVADQAFECQRTVRALEAFDSDAYKQGIVISAAALLLLLAVLVWALL